MVYVDTPTQKLQRGRLCCRMTADAPEELDAFAEEIGLPRKWFRYSGTHLWHSIVTPDYLDRAVEHGATLLNSREWESMMRYRLMNWYSLPYVKDAGSRNGRWY